MGASGDIGEEVCRRLKAFGCEVRAPIMMSLLLFFLLLSPVFFLTPDVPVTMYRFGDLCGPPGYFPVWTLCSPSKMTSWTASSVI